MLHAEKGRILLIIMIRRRIDGQGPRMSPHSRLLVLTEIAAAEAAQNASVLRFRENVLRGQLLDPEDVNAWIRDRAAEDGTAQLITLELPPGTKAMPEDWRQIVGENLSRTALVSIETPTLEFPITEADVPNNLNAPVAGALYSSVSIRWDGVLGQLKRVAEELSRDFHWKERDAVGFILTGQAPNSPTANITLHCAPPYDQPTRIVVELSPQTKVEEVKKLFQILRRQTPFGPSERFRRFRPLTKKRRELAVFLARTPSLSWGERMVLWNKEHEKWEYREINRKGEPDPRNFRRDALAAYRRATGRRWRPPQ